MKRRIEDLEDRLPASLGSADSEDDRKLRREQAITRMILDEFAHLKAELSGEAPPASPRDLLERAVRGVVEDQYSDLDQESRQYIADGWIETIHSWTRLDWMVRAGREGPPSA